MTWLKTTGLVAATVAIASPLANAQEFFTRDRYTRVTDRFQPDFDPEPVRVGTFLANPVLTAGIEANDNIFAVPDGVVDGDGNTISADSDVIARLGVASRITSDWGRHQLNGNASIDHREFFDFGDESFTTFAAGVGGRFDATRDFNIEANAFGINTAEPRTSEAAARTFAEPIEFTQLGFSIQGNYTRDRVRVRSFVDVNDFDYNDATLSQAARDALGTPEAIAIASDQGFRSNTFSRLGGQVAYAISPDVAFFGQAEVNQREHDVGTLVIDELTGEERLANRDSEGYRVEVGADFELPSLLRGDVAVGYLEETRDDPAFADFSGLSLDAALSWFPTRLTTVTGTAYRRTIDVGLVSTGGALETGFGGRVDHELRRNVLIFARADFLNREFEDFELLDGSVRDDDSIIAGLGATYKLNKRMHLDAAYNLFDRSSNDAFAEFNRNTFSLTLRVFP